MVEEFSMAPDEVIDLAEELIEAHHPWLRPVRVGFVMRARAPKGNGRVVLGYARKVSEENRLHVPFDFIITLSADKWETLTPLQRRALVDHELCHCVNVGGDLRMRPHDVEEFYCIWQRYGFWAPGEGMLMQKVVQEALLVEGMEGRVGKVPVAQMQWLVPDEGDAGRNR